MTTAPGPSDRCPPCRKCGPRFPQSIGIMPRPRKMNPVQVMTFFDISGLLVENMRIAVVLPAGVDREPEDLPDEEGQSERRIDQGSKPADPMSKRPCR